MIIPKTALKHIYIQAAWWLAWAIFCTIFLGIAFKFNIFSARHWAIVSKYGFHGFRGTALLISIAAALPVGAALAVLFWRQGGFKKPPKKPETPANAHSDFAEIAEIIETKKDLPEELRNAYVRMRRDAHPAKNQMPAPMQQKSKPKADDLFAMDDFDPAPNAAPNNAPAPNTQAPTFESLDFKPLEFGKNKKDKDEGESKLFLRETNDTIRIIAKHDDEGSWFADEKEQPGQTPQWFSEGGQKTSPVYLALQKAADLRATNPDKKVVAVLKLYKDNIINKAAMLPIWTELGIVVED
ncbi:MAG: hypothetical protein LBB23_01740 [Rickettsiales bacterium]|jgi:hypothetical protein|nr:hypothetical protein [Rickettsiales bacterium]